MEADGGGWKLMKVGRGGEQVMKLMVRTLDFPCMSIQKVSVCTMIAHAVSLNSASTLSESVAVNPCYIDRFFHEG